MLSENYLASIQRQLMNYKVLAEKAMDQLQPPDLFLQPNEESNNIAIIVQHMAGNMISRWTDLFNSDGEKSWRNRDAEFEIDLNTKEAVMQRWEQGWSCLLKSVAEIKPGQLEENILIRNEPHTVVEAINRQLTHYAYHVGQIVYLSKQFKGKAFKSLSIPKNESQLFNENNFGKAQ